MIVVADTTPLHYLILIDQATLLPLLFSKVLLPYAAYNELLQPQTPPKVREWIAQPPAWLEVTFVAASTNLALTSLDLGEREAIQLALDLGISTVLMDEAEGRRVAQALLLEVRGTLGVLEEAAKLGKVDLRLALSALRGTNFRMLPALLDTFLKRNL